jgi:hypothetical protein
VRRSDTLENLFSAVYKDISIFKGIAVDFPSKITGFVASVMASHLVQAGAGEVLRNHLV